MKEYAIVAQPRTPLDDLSLHALTFLAERTDFSEPWLGFGFASQIEAEIKSALERKRNALGIQPTNQSGEAR